MLFPPGPFLPALILLYAGSGVPDEILAQRLDRVRTTNEARLAELEALFTESGCSGDRLSRQLVKGSKLPNLICTLPGDSPETVVVGAHYDFAGKGTGVIDNWSGASLLPSLFQALASTPRRYSIVFIGFTGEEKGLAGSTAFIRQWTEAGRLPIVAMLNLECLGTSQTQLWVSRADKRLVNLAAASARDLSLPISGSNVEQVGDSDSKEFARRKIPVLDIHSVTQQTLPLLHSGDDRREHIHFPYYRDSYLIVLAMLDRLNVSGLPPRPLPSQRRPRRRLQNRGREGIHVRQHLRSRRQLQV